MSENTVVITEKDGKYHINNNGISEFALLGILECIVFEMKTVKRQGFLNKEELSGGTEDVVKETAPDVTTPKSNVPDLRTRISNAIKAIKSLGAEVRDFAADNATDEELQEELETLRQT